MWKPGTAAPPTGGSKRPRPEALGVDTTTQLAAATTAVPAPGRTLSGATQNMRFMQRTKKQQQGSRNADAFTIGATTEQQSSHHQQQQKAVTSMPGQRDSHTNRSNALISPGTLVSTNLQQKEQPVGMIRIVPNQSRPHLSTATVSSVFVPVLQHASSLDMYGWEQAQVLGRRSFGGFQPVTAENWYRQQQQQQHKNVTSSLLACPIKRDGLNGNLKQNNQPSKKKSQKGNRKRLLDELMPDG